MPDATITSTASTFGTITGTFSADQSTVTGTITGIITGTLTGSVGVPGQQGPTGPQGPQGVPGEGVPVGGTAGQFLTKIDGTNYNTDWTTLNLSAYLTKAGNLEGLTNLPTARDNIGLGVDAGPEFNQLFIRGGITVDTLGDGNGIIFGNLGEQLVPYPGLSILNGYATESWVTTGFAAKASPAFTGNPTAPTPTLSDNDTSIATTAFVKGQGYLTSASLSGYATESWVTAGFAPIAAGLPSNGAEGQILVKQSATAYDVEWQDNFATELRMPARNETGSTLTKGTVVYISGGAGNKPLLSKALATSDATSAQTIGLVTADIPNNSNGDVTIRGQLKNLDTSSFSVGAQLYLSGTTAGAFTATKTLAPTHLVYVGIVVRSNSTEGAIEVAVQNGYELDELHDVSLSSEANNDLLAYESSTNLWKNKTFSALGLLTSATAASTYAPIASPTFTGTVTIPAGASITGYLTTTDAASTYQTIAGMSSYLTTSAAASTYYPLSGNPSGFLTSSSLTGYATESWVTTALGSYLTTSAASSTYLSKADNLASVASTSTARSNLGLGSLDTPTFAGVNIPGSGTSVANLGATSLTINQQGSGQFTIQPSQGIVFPDTTIQTTAVNATVLGDYLTKAGNLSGLASTSTARTNLGLGTLATVNDAPSDGNEYVRKNAAWSVATGGGGSGGVDVQTFGSSTTSGSFTWTKPAGAKEVKVVLYGGGGGGASGARQATTANRSGGGAGGGGGVWVGYFNASVLGATETVVVGAGGAGGAARTADNSANAGGSVGEDTTFAGYRGKGGNPSTSTSGGASRNSMYFFYFVSTNGAGMNGTTTTGTSGSGYAGINIPCLGGGGGAGATANVTTNRNGGGGNGFIAVSTSSGLINTIAGGSGGTTAGVQATAGTNSTNDYGAGTGGGGGFYITGNAGGTGGAGGWPGGGGGGGGASDNGFASGAGGKGANGYAVIITYF